MLVISKLNPLDFKVRDSALPNWENTLQTFDEEEFDGIVRRSDKQQLFLASQTIPTQVKTDFDTGTDSVEATLVDENGNQTPLVVNVVFDNVILSELDTKITFYQFDLQGLTEGCYYVDVKGIKSGSPNEYRRSEKFEIVEGVTEYRRNIDNALPYTYIKDHLKFSGTNSDNNFDIYYADGFTSEIWIPCRFNQRQVEGEVDTYDNNGNLSKLQDILQRSGELTTDSIPAYLAEKAQYLAGTDQFKINDLEFVSVEKGESEYTDNLDTTTLTISLTQKYAIGVNSDDVGFEIGGDAVSPVEVLEALNASGSDNFSAPAGYLINAVTLRLKSGTSANVKIGLSPSSDDVVEWDLDTIGKVVPINVVQTGSLDSGYFIYYEITGVGATVDIVIQTIINS
jgi:hypothetical protein